MRVLSFMTFFLHALIHSLQVGRNECIGGRALCRPITIWRLWIFRLPELDRPGRPAAALAKVRAENRFRDAVKGGMSLTEAYTKFKVL